MKRPLHLAVMVSLAAHAVAGVLLPSPQARGAGRVLDVALRLPAEAARPAPEPAPVPPARPAAKAMPALPVRPLREAPKPEPQRPALAAAHTQSAAIAPASAQPTPAPRVAVEAEPDVARAPVVMAATSSALSPPRFDADYLANPPPAYPPAARRRRIEGTVMLDVLVGADGRPHEVRVASSSGSEELDAAALAAVRGWRFAPARRGDVSVEGEVRVPVRFRLDS